MLSLLIGKSGSESLIRRSKLFTSNGLQSWHLLHAGPAYYRHGKQLLCERRISLPAVCEVSNVEYNFRLLILRKKLNFFRNLVRLN